MRWTSGCRTTSFDVNCVNATPSTPGSTFITCLRPDSCCLGRSVCVMSPVTTAFEPKPYHVVRRFSHRPRVGLHFLADIAGEKAKPLPRLHRRTHQHYAAHAIG